MPKRPVHKKFRLPIMPKIRVKKPRAIKTYSLSIAQRLRQASTMDELQEAIMDGRGYVKASDATRRKWDKLAEIRRQKIAGQ